MDQEASTMRPLLAGFICLLTACLPMLAQDDSHLGETHDWFLLREHAAERGVSSLCKGLVAASFENRPAAERELRIVLRKMPHSDSSYVARGALVKMYFRDGQYRKALRQADHAIAERPAAEDMKAVHSVLSKLAQFPDLAIAGSRPATLRSEVIDGNLFIPVTANGVAGSYLVDSGANISIMSESEARRLGLKVAETASKMADISGTATIMRITEVKDLLIGRTHLKHVAFAIYPDANQPFVDLPEAHKGVLGISVLLALRSFRMGKGNCFDILPGPAPASAKVLPLAFDGMLPVAQMGLAGKKLCYTLDTGANVTVLGPVFAAAYPELMGSGIRQEHKLTGLAGSTPQESLKLPSLRFLLGNEVRLAPATVLLKTTMTASEWAAGNLGFDLIAQTLPMIIDFRAMQLTVN
jgi:predicted aspartyl protease